MSHLKIKKKYICRRVNKEIQGYPSRKIILSWVLGVFVELRKATFRFMSGWISVSHHETPSSHWKNFRKIWYLKSHRKSVEKIQVLLLSDKNNGYCT